MDYLGSTQAHLTDLKIQSPKGGQVWCVGEGEKGNAEMWAMRVQDSNQSLLKSRAYFSHRRRKNSGCRHTHCGPQSCLRGQHTRRLNPTFGAETSGKNCGLNPRCQAEQTHGAWPLHPPSQSSPHPQPPRVRSRLQKKR